MAAAAVVAPVPDSSQTLVNGRLVKAWLTWAVVWMSIFPLVGVLVSVKFHAPDFLGETAWLTWGRIRPVHVNGVIFGAFSPAALGMMYYFVPRLCGRPMVAEQLGWWELAAWNIFLVIGVVMLLMGYNAGFEVDEFPWLPNAIRFAVLAVIMVQVMLTVFTRREPRFYVALWYAIAALIWTALNMALGNVVLPYVTMPGMTNAMLHGSYIHYTVGLWITPAGLAMMYYVMPSATKNPLYSHGLSLLGFWTLALFYPFVGLHHYLFSPEPFHSQSVAIMASMMMIIPVFALVVNMLGTVHGRWGEVLGGKSGDAYAAKFLVVATIYYLFGSFQGSVEALRRMQELTHFNDFVIAHSHLTVFGAFVIAAVGAIYYAWPRLVGRELWSPRLASWNLWLFISGGTLMFTGLSAQGFVQGSMLEYGADFVDTVKEMKPWWVARTLAGATMDIAFLLLVINLYSTARYGKPLAEGYGAPRRGLEARPGGDNLGRYGEPSAVFLVAGVGFFVAAIIIQGVLPGLLLEEKDGNRVQDVATGATINVADYTPQEKQGRQVYIREGCWYCHSQYIRPVTGETIRWGPVSQAGEFAFDQPQMLSTRRIGPDLSRVGLKYEDGWHIAHHWNPRDVVPDSIMPRFPWLFERGKDGTPVLNADGRALMAYLQRLGTNIGDWRETFASTRLTAGEALQSAPSNAAEVLTLGREVYERRCIGCHGVKGDGKGPSAVFLATKPRDFTQGIFKFHSTAGQNALPTDQDLFVTITHGLWGTAMPPWYSITSAERSAVIHYIKTFSKRWQTEDVEAPITVPPEPAVTAASIKHGGELFAACTSCHGDAGRGDGPLAALLTNVWGLQIRPANFTLAAGVTGGVKLGHDGRHIFKVIMNGIGGGPMPAFADSMKPPDVWDIVHFVQSLRIDAHVQELQKAGLQAGAEQQARTRLWQDISSAAGKGQIETAVLQVGHPFSVVQNTALGSKESASE
jgi:cbb3-type cytochrome c oxidase subunit I